VWQTLIQMTDRTIDNKILNYLHSLDKAEQLSVLDYLRNLLKKTGKKNNKNKELLSLAGSIKKSDLKKMELAIEEGCESKLRTDNVCF